MRNRTVAAIVSIDFYIPNLIDEKYLSDIDDFKKWIVELIKDEGIIGIEDGMKILKVKKVFTRPKWAKEKTAL